MQLYRKGMIGMGMGSSGRQGISLILGFIFLFLGVIPLLFQFGVLDFTIPALPGMVLWILATIGGVILLWDAMIENMPMGAESILRMASLIAGLIVLVIGLIPLLHNFGWIAFTLPYIAEIINNGLFVVVGALLLYGAAKQF